MWCVYSDSEWLQDKQMVSFLNGCPFFHIYYNKPLIYLAVQRMCKKMLYFVSVENSYIEKEK